MIDKDFFYKNLLYNFATSITQGTGLGSTISLIDMIKSSSIELQRGFLVSKDVMDLLEENNIFNKKILETINYVIKLLDEKYSLAEVDSLSLISKIKSSFQNLTPFIEKKKLAISFSQEKFQSIKLKLNMDKLLVAIEEIYLNAIKYSKSETGIQFSFSKRDEYLCVSIKNVVDDDSYGGIPKDKESQVMEPFYRIHPPMEEYISVEKLGLGLGLTVVESIARKHHGQFFIYGFSDNSAQFVLAEILLPIMENRS